MARILSIVPWARYTPHFETDLELMQLHLDRGDEVTVVACDAELPACDRNPGHDLARCSFCVGKRRFGLPLLDGRVARLPLYRLSDADREELRTLPVEFDDASALKALRVDGFDLGYGVLSSMVSFARDPDPISGANRETLASLLRATLAVYRSVRRHLAEGSFDRVYVFNGRFAITRAVLRACQAEGVECRTHERGHDHRHYATFANTSIHDLDMMDARIRARWEEGSSDPEREAIGERFYTDRAGGKEQSWFSFVEQQQAGLLPEDWDPEKTNVVAFISSEDEFVAIGDRWKNPVYENQMDGVARIAASLARDPDYHFYVRVHPNLRGVENEQTAAIARLDGDNLTVVAADSPVSTYALVRAASKVVTFASTVGIEATYWGTPSILAGPSFYRKLGGTWNPEDHDELVRMLRSDLEPKPREPAIMYGYFWSTFGTPYRHYDARGVFRGRFRGRVVRPGLLRLGMAALLRGLPPLERLLRRRALRRIGTRLLGEKT